jgi:hypothetical protein
MGKYEALSRYLQKTEESKIELTFEKIVEILGKDLPESALIHPEWWSNPKIIKKGEHVQATDGWMAAGWYVLSVDPKGKKVVFETYRK